MPALNVFLSFEYDKDKSLKGSFFAQAKTLTPHRVRDSSLKEAYEEKEWEDKAKKAIRKCDIVIVLVGQDTHNASGVETEVEIAQKLGKPFFQVVPKRRTYKGLPEIDEPIRWKWKRINKKIDEVWTRRQRG